MLYITTKLKRLKYMRMTASIILFPFRLPLMLLYWLGKLSEIIDGFIFQTGYHKIEYFIIDKLHWNDVAKKQYKDNPDKFKH